MRDHISVHMERARVSQGPFASPEGSLFGAFLWRDLKIISSGVQGVSQPDHDPEAAGWEHVSVSHKLRPPTWGEMDAVKRQFWTDEECVMQLHVPRTEHINQHANCLHLWRPVDGVIPRPPFILV